MDTDLSPSAQVSLDLLEPGHARHWMDMAYQHYPVLEHIAAHYFSDRAKIEDVVQDTIVTGFAKIQGCHAKTKREFFAWLHTILARKCLDQKRKAVPLSLDASETDPPGSEDFENFITLQVAVDEILSHEDANTRQEWQLWVQGWTLSAIAQHCQQTPGAVAGRNARLRKKLQNLLFPIE